jgi:hypothetical protein
LDTPRLVELFTDDAVIHDLRELGARVTLMLSDLSPDPLMILAEGRRAEQGNAL